MYAQIVDNIILQTGGLPDSARRLDTGQWILNLADADEPTREACGWYEVVDTPRPDDTPTATFDHSIELVDGTPTVVWTERDVPRPLPTVEQLTGLPVPEPSVPSQTPEQVAVVVIREEIDVRLSPSDVNSIAEVKAAIRDGLDAASQRLAGN